MGTYTAAGHSVVCKGSIRVNCKAIVPAKWYQRAHPCLYPAHPNGYCARHNPEKKLAALKRREKKLTQQLNGVRKSIHKTQGILAKIRQ